MGRDREIPPIGWLDFLSVPAALDRMERRFWLDLWRGPVLDAIEEQCIELRRYGPVQAMVASTLPEAPLLNLVLGASAPGAASDGHLAEALEWADSRKVHCRVPVGEEMPESASAEDVLDQYGYEKAESGIRFVRDASPPEFPEPPGTKVIEVGQPVEGFAELLMDGYELELGAGCFFDSLPGRELWRCYIGLDEDEHCVAAAAMMIDFDLAQVGFLATRQDSRRKGAHMALLRRCIDDATAGGCKVLFAESSESLDERAEPSPGCRNLVRAGFEQQSLRRAWKPSRAQQGGHAIIAESDDPHGRTDEPR